MTKPINVKKTHYLNQSPSCNQTNHSSKNKWTCLPQGHERAEKSSMLTEGTQMIKSPQKMLELEP